MAVLGSLEKWDDDYFRYFAIILGGGWGRVPCTLVNKVIIGDGFAILRGNLWRTEAAGKLDWTEYTL